jgi:hypothetical protein
MSDVKQLVAAYGERVNGIEAVDPELGVFAQDVIEGLRASDEYATRERITIPQALANRLRKLTSDDDAYDEEKSTSYEFGQTNVFTYAVDLGGDRVCEIVAEAGYDEVGGPMGDCVSLTIVEGGERLVVGALVDTSYPYSQEPLALHTPAGKIPALGSEVEVDKLGVITGFGEHVHPDVALALVLVDSALSGITS